ncbi:MAG: hypothetical protein Q9163_003014 [Psora crenata]
MASSGPDGLLRSPSHEEQPILERLHSSYNPLHTFDLPKGDQKQYQQQFSDIYFLRLAKLKPAVEELATEAWEDFQIGSEKVRHVDRVLDVRQGELCWVAGTHWIAAPPPREKYISSTDSARTMLEDESGRLRLIGTPLELNMLVTGCIIAVMGTENADGDFEVVDLKIPDLPRQPQRWERDEALALLADGDRKPEVKTRQEWEGGGKVAIVSGLGISGDEGDPLKLDLLMEFLLGEACGPQTQQEVAKISRLIIAGNSVSEGNLVRSDDEFVETKKASKKYGYDASAYNPLPTAHLDEFLASLLPSIPITILPGESDPANASLPQQPIHQAMFFRARNYSASSDSSSPGWLDCVTNPWEADIDGWRIMGNGGQPVDDIFKYTESKETLDVLESLLRWRCGAPTAPDTLCCYPFQEKDQFVIEECPHVFFVGNQAEFETTVIEGSAGQSVRLIAVPKFREKGEVVLLDTKTLEAKLLIFNIFNDS